MFNEVRNLIANQRIHEDDLSEAFVILQERQFLFRAQSRDRRFYELIDEHFSIFENGFQLFGMKLHQNNDYGYIGYTPSHYVSKMSISESILLFTFRLIYHLEKEYRSNEDGSITITGSHLVAQYQTLSDRADLNESTSRFQELLKPFHRKSIIRLDSEKNEETDLPNITILPSIEILVTPDFASKFIENLRGQNLIPDDNDEDMDATITEGDDHEAD